MQVQGSMEEDEHGKERGHEATGGDGVVTMRHMKKK